MRINESSWIVSGVCAIGLTCAAAMAAEPDCSGRWLPGFSLPSTNGPVSAMTVWDPDDAGPLPPMLVIGGTFTIVADTAANNIAAFDGQHWTALGSGTNGAVKALASYQGKLYAGGTFTQAGGNPSGAVASWDGASWQSTGIEPSSINALTVYQDKLVAGGNFSINGGGANIAEWNGTSWGFLGILSGVSGEVNALTVYDGKLIAGGGFTKAGVTTVNGIAQWDGAWSALGSGIQTNKTVKSLGVYGNYLFVGGNFTTAGDVESRYLARWTGGQWEPSGAPFSLDSSASVNAIATFNGSLVVGASTVLDKPLTWDGQSWNQMNGGIGGTQALAVFNGSLYAGNSATNAGLLAFESGAWRYLADGFDRSVDQMAVHADDVAIGTMLSSASGNNLRSTVRWNGYSWSEYGPFPSSAFSLAALGDVNGSLYAGATFANSAGGMLARWTGSTWTSFDPAIPVSATFSSVRWLDQYQGHLLAAGSLRPIGQTTRNAVWIFDGSQWQSLGAVFTSTGPVTASAVYHGDLYLAGASLSLAASPSSGSVFRYDGATWSKVGPSGLKSGGSLRPIVLQVFQDRLIVASSQIQTGVGGFSYGPVASWDGTTVSSIAAPGVQSIGALGEYHGDLVFGGIMTDAFGVGANGVARWNGTTFSAFGQGLTGGSVNQLQTSHDELIAGGDFVVVGSGAARFARWTDTPKPWVALKPQSHPVNKGLTLTLTAAPASGYSDVTFKWQHNGADISDGPGGASPGGGTVSGSSGTLASPTDGTILTLTITGVQPSDAGLYGAVFTSPCGQTASGRASIDVNACPGDLNGDSIVDDADFAIFGPAYDTMLCTEPAMPLGCLSDLNGDGVVDDTDFQIFVLAYAAMVCE